MNNNQKWGRKETIVWPPHAPVYTFCALALGFCRHHTLRLAVSPLL